MCKALLLVTALSITPLAAFGSDDHHHEQAVEPAPHGGNLRDAGNLKAEVVLNGDSVKLYVYDKKLKPIAMKEMTLDGDVQFPREKTKPITLKKSGDHFETTITGISKVHRYDLHVYIMENGKKLKVDFGIDNI